MHLTGERFDSFVWLPAADGPFAIFSHTCKLVLIRPRATQFDPMLARAELESPRRKMMWNLAICLGCWEVLHLSYLKPNSDRDCFSEHAIPHEVRFHDWKLAAKLIPFWSESSLERLFYTLLKHLLCRCLWGSLILDPGSEARYAVIPWRNWRDNTLPGLYHLQTWSGIAWTRIAR